MSYSVIGDAILPQNVGANQRDDENACRQQQEQNHAPTAADASTQSLLVLPPLQFLYGIGIRVLTIGVWLTAVVFASFTAVHYVRTTFQGDETKKAWDLTDKGLYREATPSANHLMVAHFLAGIYLMLAGPIQLIKPFRQRFLHVHRIMGRLYIGTALVAASCATAFVLLYGTPRKNRHEDVNNVLFGLSVLLCATQSVRHAAFTKQIDRHKKWSWRLYALILGVLLFRLYKTTYNYFIVAAAPPNHQQQQQYWTYNALFYLLFLPNLMVVEYLWYRRLDPRLWWDVGLVASAAIFLSFASLHIATASWIPAMLVSSYNGTSSAIAVASEYN